MSVFCLGQEDFEAAAVHITREAAGTIAMCGHSPIKVITTGVDEDQYLCDDCAYALDGCEEVPALFTVMRMADADDRS